MKFKYKFYYVEDEKEVYVSTIIYRKEDLHKLKSKREEYCEKYDKPIMTMLVEIEE